MEEKEIFKLSRIQKVEATFHFLNNYIDTNGIEQNTTVVLSVNYKNKTYDIKLLNAVASGFEFETMLEAFGGGIEQAIDFGNKELKHIFSVNGSNDE